MQVPLSLFRCFCRPGEQAVGLLMTDVSFETQASISGVRF